MIRECLWCGKEFNGTGRRVFCCPTCRNWAHRVASRDDISIADATYREWYKRQFCSPEHEEALNRGVNYGKVQEQKTLELVGRVRV